MEEEEHAVRNKGMRVLGSEKQGNIRTMCIERKVHLK